MNFYPNLGAMKNIIILIIFVSTVFQVSAQYGRKHDELNEKYHSQKVAYITNALEFTSEESAAFWPIYNEYEAEKRNLQEDMWEYRSSQIDNEESITEEEAKKALEKIQMHMDEMHQMEKEYQNKYLEVLPAKKVLLLMKAEKDFRRKLLKELGRKREQRRGR
jgi:flagellar biosynthesis GTPase FlhF